jgi:hypothetical protein
MIHSPDGRSYPVPIALQLGIAPQKPSNAEAAALETDGAARPIGTVLPLLPVQRKRAVVPSAMCLEPSGSASVNELWWKPWLWRMVESWQEPLS